MKLLQVAIAVDQLVGTILLGCDADETMSAKLWRCRDKHWRYALGRKLVDGLFFWQPQHCYNAYLSELNRTQAPKEYRDAGNR